MAELLVPWEYKEHGSLPKIIPVTVFSNKEQIERKRGASLEEGELPLLFLTGYGQKGTISETIDLMGRNYDQYAMGIKSPWSDVSATYSAVEAVGKEVLHSVADFVKGEVVRVPLSTPIAVTGLSEGGLTTAAALTHRHEGIGTVVFLATPVRSVESMDSSEPWLMAQFLLRFGKEGLKQKSLLGAEARASTKSTIQQLRSDRRTGHFVPKFGTAVRIDYVPQVAVDHAHLGNNVAFISGKRDHISHLPTARTAFGRVSGYSPDDSNPAIIGVPRLAHPTPLSPHGQKLIGAGIDFLQSAT